MFLILQEGQFCQDFTEKENCWGKLLRRVEPSPPPCPRRVHCKAGSLKDDQTKPWAGRAKRHYSQRNLKGTQVHLNLLNDN